MPTLRLRVDENALTLDDLIRLEEGNTSTKFLRDLLARFAVGDDGQALAPEAALALVGKLSLRETKDAIAQFGAAVKGINEQSVTPLPEQS